MKEYTENVRKWIISIVSGAIFLVISSPLMYGLTQRFIAKPLGLSFLGATGPTMTGLLVHTAVFILVVRLMME